MSRHAASHSATVLLLLGLLLPCGPSRSQQRYFYFGRDYGSEAQYNPLSLVLNGSYDIIQMDGHSRHILDYPYAELARNTFHNLGNPFGVIDRWGWSTVLRTELLPLEFGKRKSLWWPNYQLHLIGGGMSYVAMSEWYEEHGFPAPAAWSLATMAAYHLLNEINETDTWETPDPIVDIYVFDLGGIILFSFDGVKEFFSSRLNLADWSLQPSFTLAPVTLQNNGQYFSVKWKLPFSDHWHLFYLTGMNGLLGASYRFDGGAAVSTGLGLRARKIVASEPASAQRGADLVWTAGLFLDVRNSLLASLVMSGLVENTVTLNVYPGLLAIGSFSPGCWLAINRDASVAAGLTTRWFPGVAVK